MLFAKEFKNNSLMAILAGIMIVLLAGLLPMFHFSIGYIIKFYEVVVSMVAAIYCAYLIYNGSDLEICLTTHISVFRFFLTKYVTFLSLVFLMGLIQFLYCVIFMDVASGLVFVMALMPATLVLSTLALLITLIFKSVGSGMAVILVLVAFESWVGQKLANHTLPRYYYEFISVYDTTFMYGKSDLWLTNRFIMLGASVVMWGIIYIIVKIRGRDLV